jgi:DNA adenine methylase
VRVPHVIPYQGSKRSLTDRILAKIRFNVEGRLYEPFAGSAALTLAAANDRISDTFIVGDKYPPLMKLWELIIEDPNQVCQKYREIWINQLENPKKYYLQIRDEFNLDGDPVKFLYLIARCVKNSIRFNALGEFNQSPDNRRLGRKPAKMAAEIQLASVLLKGKVVLRTGDFMEVLHDATAEDIVYLDPPWQGTSNNRDPRYAHLLDFDFLVESLHELNSRNIPFLLSFDGSCGGKEYGNALPKSLELRKISLNAGRSSQATLLGRDEKTIESLYLSPMLVKKNEAYQPKAYQQLSMFH